MLYIYITKNSRGLIRTKVLFVPNVVPCLFETNNNKKNIGSFEMENFFQFLLFQTKVSRFYPSSISKYLATFFLPVVCARFSQLVPYQLELNLSDGRAGDFPVLFQMSL